MYTAVKCRPYISWLVVSVAVVEHLAKVSDAFLGAVVSILFQLPLDGAHVHGTLDHGEVVLERTTQQAGHLYLMDTGPRTLSYWNIECNRVNWFLEGPGVVVSPQHSDHRLQEVLELVGDTSLALTFNLVHRTACRRSLRGWGLGTRLVLREQTNTFGITNSQ